MNVSYGRYGIQKDPTQAAAFAASQGDEALAAQELARLQGGGGMGGGVLDFLGNLVGAAGDIIGGITGVKIAKENAAATVEATRNQLATAAIAYKGQALNAQLAPVLQAQQLQVRQAQTRALLSTVLVLGGGALILAFILSTRKRKKR